MSLSEYQDDSREGGGTPATGTPSANHNQNSVMSAHCGNADFPTHHPEPYCENLETFHAEFITHPIDYPLDNGSPPPLSLTQAPAQTSSAPSLSPSGLPSFMDTYSPAPDRGGQERFFKQEPAGTPPTPTFNPPTSSYPSHGYANQGFPFPKKEEPTFNTAPSMSEFYQPQSFAQFTSFSADTTGARIFEPHEDVSSVTPSALTHALQGMVQAQGQSRILAKRTQYSPSCTETSG